MTINEAVTYSLTNENDLYDFVEREEEPIKL